MPVSDSDRTALEQALPAWLSRQRWFGAKTRPVVSVNFVDWADIPPSAAIVLARVHYEQGAPDVYQLPLSITAGRIDAGGEIATLPSGAVVHDAAVDENFRQALLRMIEEETSCELGDGGSLGGHRSSAFAAVRGEQPLTSRVSSAEQSNTSIIFGNRMMLKVFRRLQPGENPDVEIGRFLTDVAHFPHIATFLGEIVLQQRDGSKTSTAMLQEFVPNQGDGWQATLDELAAYYAVESSPPPSAEAAALLGRRTAEMHLALATETTDEAFRAEPLTPKTLAADGCRIREQITAALDALERSLQQLPADATEDAKTLLTTRNELLAKAGSILHTQPSGQRIRIHGDFHLGQVLRANGDFILLDFEGEPARSLVERRAKQCPLKDVAGMLRSFSYAAWSGLEQHRAAHGGMEKTAAARLHAWLDEVSARFLNAYNETIESCAGLLPEPGLAQSLLDAYLLEKAAYELLYELNNRPTWVRIPLSGMLALSAPGESHHP